MLDLAAEPFAGWTELTIICKPFSYFVEYYKAKSMTKGWSSDIIDSGGDALPIRHHGLLYCNSHFYNFKMFLSWYH